MLVFKKDPFFQLVDSFFNVDEETNHQSHGNVIWNQSHTENDYIVEFIVPGLHKTDITVSIEDNQLKVSHEKTDDTSKYVGSFSRLFDLPEDVNDKKISASVENGVLKVTLPKNKKKTTTRTVSIT